MEFPMLEVVTASCAIHRFNGGFIKKSDAEWSEDKTSNSNLLYQHFFENNVTEVNKQDREQAKEIVEYLSGLGIKSFERDLTDFEKQVLRFVTSETIGRDKLGIASSLPSVYFGKLSSDEWEYREKELGRTSKFQGVENSREHFTLKVEYKKYIPTTFSYLITTSIDNKHIVKFFAQKAELEIGKEYKISGYVKPHIVNKHTSFEETMINRIRIHDPK